MWKMVESRYVEDQWYIYRRLFGFIWVLQGVRTGIDRAAMSIVEAKINDDLASTADEIINIKL